MVFRGFSRVTMLCSHNYLNSRTFSPPQKQPPTYQVVTPHLAALFEYGLLSWRHILTTLRSRPQLSNLPAKVSQDILSHTSLKSRHYCVSLIRQSGDPAQKEMMLTWQGLFRESWLAPECHFLSH